MAESPLADEHTQDSSTNHPDDEWLNTTQAAFELGFRPSKILRLIGTRALDAKKVEGRWLIQRSALENYKSGIRHVSHGGFLVSDTGIIEISIGLTGATAAIMALAPNAFSPRLAPLKVLIFIISLVAGFVTLYTSLWLLGEYVEDTEHLIIKHGADSEVGWGHIRTLLTTPKMGPYWLLAISLILLFFLLALVGAASTLSLTAS